MANQPKKYKKFVATAATATLVASAIVPVASAEFNDISKLDAEAQEAINALVDLDVINGSLASFNPTASITRGQVVKMLGKLVEAQGAEIPEDWNTDARFTDLSVNAADQELVKYAALANDYGVFNGSNGKLNAAGNITRQQMALVLNRAYEAIFGTSLVDLAADLEDETVADLDSASAEAQPAIQALADLGITVLPGGKYNPAGNVTRAQFALFINRSVNTVVEFTPAIESVTAVNKTTLEVKFNVALDSVAAENFTVEGATVTAATLSEDKKTVTLAVSGLDYEKSYTVATKNIKVDGEVVEFGSETVTTPAVTALWNLQVAPAATQVTANGADNTVIQFKLLDSTGKVDTAADNIVLAIDATFGNLANSRVTIQDGVGQVVLSSEFSTKELTSKVTAQIIEASGDYKDLIGKVQGIANVKFVPSGATTDINAVTFLDAESNQADRVVLYFDKAVSPATFVQTTTDGKFVTADVKSGNTVVYTKQVVKNNVNIAISQNNVTKEIIGFKSVDGNSKAIEVILAKKTAAGAVNTLTDNSKVKVSAQLGTTNNSKEFVLTDARQPEVTSIAPEGLRKLKLKFSEAVDAGTLKIDGLFEEGTEFAVTYGDFVAATGVDNRDIATVELKTYLAGRPGTTVANTGKNRYFEPGSHSLTITNLKDFAGLNDPANVSTSQTLQFNVVADTSAPTATVKVESPEQIRVTFDKEVNFTGNLATIFGNAFEVYDTTQNKYVSIATLAAKFNLPAFTVEQYENQFVVELTQDWTNILKVNTDAYYNYKFQFNIPVNTFENAANGVGNALINLDLSYAGSPLVSADNISPVIQAIDATAKESEYKVTMSEPVKLTTIGNVSKDNNPTVATSQTSGLPTVQVEFQGKDKDGKNVVIAGTVQDYTKTTADKGEDTAFIVQTVGTTLQALVDAGHSEDWTVVVKSISDDVGNTAATLTKAFKVTKTVANNAFQIKARENTLTHEVIAFDADPTDAVVDKDRVEVTFTKAVVNNGGPSDLTSVANWTLNGQKLANVASITVADVNNNTTDGYEKVIITFNDDITLKATSNTIGVNKGVLSKDGTALTGVYEVVADTLNPLAAAARAAAVVAANAAVTAAQTALTTAQALPDTDPTKATKVAAAQLALKSAQDALAAAQNATTVAAAQQAQQAAQEAKTSADSVISDTPVVTATSKDARFTASNNTFTYKVKGTELIADLKAYADFSLTENGTVTIKENGVAKQGTFSVTTANFYDIVQQIVTAEGYQNAGDLKGRTFTFTIADVDGDNTTSAEYTLVFADIATTGLTVAELETAQKATVDYDTATSTATVTLTKANAEALGFTVTGLAVFNGTTKLGDFSAFGTDVSVTFSAESLADAKTKVVKVAPLN